MKVGVVQQRFILQLNLYSGINFGKLCIHKVYNKELLEVNFQRVQCNVLYHRMLKSNNMYAVKLKL